MPASKSKESHAEQKRLAAERKLAKPHGEIITRSKRIWEQLRRTKLAPEERKKLIAELGQLIKGRVSDLVFKHDASRIVQSALKYADKTTRANITTELKGSYVSLAQSRVLSASLTFPLILSLPSGVYCSGTDRSAELKAVTESILSSRSCITAPPKTGKWWYRSFMDTSGNSSSTVKQH